MSTIASNTETGSSESIRARWPATVEYGNSVEQNGEPRAQKRSLLCVTGTGARAFNATAMIPPNPTVTGSVIGEQAPVKSPLFPDLSLRLEKSIDLYSMADVISHRDPPRDARSQRST